jgi:hypothetical protein
VARSQIAAQVAALPNAEELLRFYDEAIARFAVGQPAEPDASLPQGMKMLLQGLEAPANLPFARELWITDAASLLEKVSAPALVVIGKKDIQVDWRLDGEPLERAASGRTTVRFQYPEHANHVLKYEARAREELSGANIVQSYNGPDTRLDPETLAAILEWLRAHV